MKTKSLEAVVRAFIERDPEDAARAVETLPPDEAAKLLADLPPAAAAPLVEKLVAHAAGSILARLDGAQVAALLKHVPPKPAAAALRHFEDEVREKVLALLEARDASRLRDLMSFGSDTAGAMMDPLVTSIAIDLTAQGAIAALRKAKRKTLHYLYVTDRDGRLVGVLTMRDLILASPRDPIEPLVIKTVQSLRPEMSRAQVAETMAQGRFLALPVVDADGHLLGVIRQDEAIAAARQQAFGDLQKMQGAGEDEHALSPVSTVIKRRLPWLYVNLVTAFAAAAVVGIFEETIQRVTALAVLLPVVAGQGGNTGAQTLAVVMRGLALREIGAGMTWRLLFKEMLGGTINGAAIGIVTAGVVWIWDGRWALAAVIGGAMIVNMGAAGLSGAIIPLLLKALRRDPAQSSSIFLTTVTDCVGFAAFLGFAVAFMPWLDVAEAAGVAA